jgi:ABC-type Mn2+/Zn2+ transport system ATPase subunit
VGENGSGKTTTLRVILGLVQPRHGEVRWARPDLHVGYVPQVDVSEVLFPVTSLEVVLMGLVPALGPWRRPRAAQRERARAALARLRAEHLCERPFRALSGGQRQRVLLARGIVADPDLLALDEPVRGLDFASAEQLVTMIEQLAAEEDMAVVVATHTLDLVANHADFVALFRDGAVEWGPAEEIFTDERLSHYHRHPMRVRTVEGRRVVLPGASS